MMEHDCIVISDEDDEDVHVIRHVVNLVPDLIDLTEGEDRTHEEQDTSPDSGSSSSSASSSSSSSSNSQSSSPRHFSSDSKFFDRNKSSHTSFFADASQVPTFNDSQTSSSSRPSRHDIFNHVRGASLFPNASQARSSFGTSHVYSYSATAGQPDSSPNETQGNHNSTASHVDSSINTTTPTCNLTTTTTTTTATISTPPTKTTTSISPSEEQSNAPTKQHPDSNTNQTMSRDKPILSDQEQLVALKSQGNEKYTKNLFDDAIRIYKRAIELAKKLNNQELSSILHFNLAMAYFKLGSYDQSADECAYAVKINQNYIKAHLKRGEIYYRQGKFEESAICYEHLCELDRTNKDFAIMLQHAKEQAKKTKKKDYWQILGLTSAFVSQEELKKAYRYRALKHHPDRHSDADIVSRKIEERKFKEISEAYSNLQKRMGFNR